MTAESTATSSYAPRCGQSARHLHRADHRHRVHHRAGAGHGVPGWDAAARHQAQPNVVYANRPCAGRRLSDRLPRLPLLREIAILPHSATSSASRRNPGAALRATRQVRVYDPVAGSGFGEGACCLLPMRSKGSGLPTMSSRTSNEQAWTCPWRSQSGRPNPGTGRKWC